MSAEKGAHHATNAGPQPTIFEVLAASNLSDLLRPVVVHMTDYLLSWKPEWHAWLVPARRAAWALAVLLVDGYHLRYYDALFAENFYGLKRSPLRPGSWRLKSLFLFLVNQLKQDISSAYESLRYDVQHGAYADKSLKSRFVRLFVWLYPMLHFLHVGVNVACHFAYVIGANRFASAELLLAGVELSTAGPEVEEEEPGVGSSRGRRLIAMLKRWSSFVLTFGIFLLQFLQSRGQQDETTAQLGAVAHAVAPPPPPQPLSSASLPSEAHLCPLCLKPRRTSSALSISGIIFCYSCIRNYVEQHGMCPITKHPASLNSIIRIFQ